MRILLIFPKWTGKGLIGGLTRKASTWQPLNLAMIGAVAQKAGHFVKILDCEAEDKSTLEMQREVKRFNPDVVGLTGTTPFFHLTVETARAVKQVSNALVCVGGTHITIMQEKAWDDAFDFGFLGEADETFPKFLSSLSWKINNYFEIQYFDVKGILYKRQGQFVNTGLAEPVQDLDSLPTPARRLLRMHKYMIGTPKGTKNFATIMTTRGCPFECIFCSSKMFGQKVRRRSVQNVVDEISQIKRDFGISHFIFLDDTFTLSRQYVIDLCQRIEPLGITFSCSTRANLIDEELVVAMKKAGLIRISFGLETADLEMREIIKKGVPLYCYSHANYLTNKHGIETLNSVMIGLPNETWATFEKTMRFLDKAKEIKQANLSIATPYVGTELFNMARRGDYGLRILTHDYSKYKRYGSAVMESDRLSAKDLLQMQNEGFIRIYSKPWRIIPMLRKSGFFGAVMFLVRLINGAFYGFIRKESKRVRTKSSFDIQ